MVFTVRERPDSVPDARGSRQRIYTRLMPTAENRQLRANALLRGIALLDKRFRAARAGWRRIDCVRGFAGPNAVAFGFPDELVAKHRQHRDFTNQLAIRRRQMRRNPSA